MNTVQPIRVGPSLPSGDTFRCAYARALVDPRCEAEATVHVITMDPVTGEPCELWSCDAHADVARLLGADSHSIGEHCRTAMWWGWSEGDREGACRLEPREEGPRENH